MPDRLAVDFDRGPQHAIGRRDIAAVGRRHAVQFTQLAEGDGLLAIPAESGENLGRLLGVIDGGGGTALRAIFHRRVAQLPAFAQPLPIVGGK